MEPIISIVTGKQGRTNANKPAYELLSEIRRIPLEIETLEDGDIEHMASDIIGLAQANQGHRFDQAYMDDHNGAYGIASIMLDTQLNARAWRMPVYRPTSHGGHVAFRTHDEIENVVKMTHDDIPIDTAGSKDLGLLAAKFQNMECILIMPDTLEHPKLLRALRLETKGDGSDTTTLVYLRVCDGLGLGRSPPHLSTGKFKFLFPGVPIDTSQVKPRAQKKRNADATDGSTSTNGTNAAEKRAKVEGNAYEILHKLLDDTVRGSATNTKGASYQTAKQFLRSLDDAVGRDKCIETLSNYTHLPGPVVMDMFGNMDVIESIVASNIEEAHISEKILGHTRALHDLVHTAFD